MISYVRMSEIVRTTVVLKPKDWAFVEADARRLLGADEVDEDGDFNFSKYVRTLVRNRKEALKNGKPRTVKPPGKDKPLGDIMGHFVIGGEKTPQGNGWRVQMTPKPGQVRKVRKGGKAA